MLGDSTAQRGDEISPTRRWCNRIINGKHAERLRSFLSEDHGGQVLMGGLEDIDVSSRFVPFTVVMNPSLQSKLMTQEIFGPLLAIYTVRDVDEGIALIKQICSTPLALYVYAEDRAVVEKLLSRCTSGSVGVNNTGEQSLGMCSPFGGVGQSGMGAYHGKFGFDEFSHHRTILYRTTTIPVGIFPKQMFPVSNALPSMVYPFVLKKNVTGFFPHWMQCLGA